MLTNLILKYLTIGLKYIYGYEALNLLMNNLPSKKINYILRLYGAKIGKNVRIKSPIIIHGADFHKKLYFNLHIGNDVYLGRDCIIDLTNEVIIKDNVTISHRVVFNTHMNLGESHILKKKYYPSTVGKIIIEKGTYIGSNVTILQNVTIGSNSLIGACSLVNNDIKSGYRAFGVPCRENKKLI